MSDQKNNQNNEREYGIGRVPADVDAADEALAAVEADEIMRQQQPTPRRMATCENCGAVVPAVLLMTSAYGSVCPGCYDECDG